MNMDKNQAKSNVLNYLYHGNFLPGARKELTEIKKLTDSKKRYERATIA